MKHSFAFILALSFSATAAIASSASAQVSDTDFMNSQFSGMMRYEQVLKRTDEVLALAEKLSAERGIEIKRIELDSKSGKPYPALQILPSGNSIQNIEAKRVSDSMSGLPLYFSPVDLSSGSQAYFTPDGSHIGIPYEFFTDGPSDSSYRHELMHADTQRRVINGETPLFSGFMKAKQHPTGRVFVSQKNVDSYSTHAALDEIMTTALSVKLETAKVLELKATLPKTEFVKQWGVARPRLASVHSSIEFGISLSKQLIDLTERALEALTQSQVEISEAPLAIGNKTGSVYQAVFRMDGFAYNSNYRLSPVPKATNFTLYSHVRPTAEEIRERLTTIHQKSVAALADFQNAIKPIAKGFVHVEMEKTDFEGLSRVAGVPFENLAR